MSDKIKLTGVMTKGYGQIPKMVTRDKELSIEAKGIYAYMASFAGAGESAFPRVDTICKDLNISEDRFRKHRNLLEEKGYISIVKNRNGGKFYNNVYIINHTIPLKRGDGKTRAPQNVGTNKNKVLNNNKDLNSSSNAFKFYEENIGMITPFNAENINFWIDKLSEELVVEALKIAVKSNKKFNYAEGILKDWNRNNVKTVDDANSKTVEFENSKKTTRKGAVDLNEFDLDD